MTLLDDLRKLGDAIDPSLLPSTNEIQKILGAVVAYTEHGDQILKAADQGMEDVTATLAQHETADQAPAQSAPAPASEPVSGVQAAPESSPAPPAPAPAPGAPGGAAPDVAPGENPPATETTAETTASVDTVTAADVESKSPEELAAEIQSLQVQLANAQKTQVSHETDVTPSDVEGSN